MLIVNDYQLLLAEGVSLKERCKYCSKPLTTYPLIMSDDAEQTVYHAACAVELATDILVDLYTFLSLDAKVCRLPCHEYSSRCGASTSASLSAPAALWRERVNGAGLDRKESQMQSANVRQIKAALVDQAFHSTTQVSCPWGKWSP